MDSSSSTYHQKRGHLFFGTQCTMLSLTNLHKSIRMCRKDFISVRFLQKKTRIRFRLSFIRFGLKNAVIIYFIVIYYLC